jgi:CRP-like cAMP-binding protein
VTPVVQEDARENLSQVARKCNDLLEIFNKEKSSSRTTTMAKAGPGDEGSKKIRRGEISAEAATAGTASSDFQSKLKAKDEKTTVLLSQVVGTNILFTGLGDSEATDIVNAFEQVKFEAGAKVISQGERGESFFVVDSGVLTVAVNNDGFSTQCGDVVSGSGFGELALMYNTPRAATVTTATGCVLWRLDRTTFKAITGYHKQKRMQDDIQFLKKVEILSKLNDREIALVADAAERETFETDTTIIRQVHIYRDHIIRTTLLSY